MYYPRMRPRRLRISSWSRQMFQEVHCHPSQFIAPVFVHDGCLGQSCVERVPGIGVYSEEAILEYIALLVEAGVVAILLFPVIADTLRDEYGSAAVLQDALMARVISRVKAAYPELGVMADVALDPYTSHGHDGICGPQGEVMNDETVEVLVRQSLLYAEAGVDVIAPSDMMDGRILAIRDALERHGYTHVQIMSYTTKFASALYGPFREVVGAGGFLSGKTKVSYQMSPASGMREVRKESYLDSVEGADILMVKPGLFYLDILAGMRAAVDLPIAAYQVSGEYGMIIAAAEKGYVDRKAALIESFTALKRAGADVIVSYVAREAALWSKEGSL